MLDNFPTSIEIAFAIKFYFGTNALEPDVCFRAQRIPERIVEQAVKGMLPSGRIGRHLFTHLKVRACTKTQFYSCRYGAPTPADPTSALQGSAIMILQGHWKSTRLFPMHKGRSCMLSWVVVAASAFQVSSAKQRW